MAAEWETYSERCSGGLFVALPRTLGKPTHFFVSIVSQAK
jgi:hypothetical protein